MAEKVLKCGIKKAKGYLYFIDKKGDTAMRLELDIHNITFNQKGTGK